MASGRSMNRIAVIGAGWAGLSAALALHQGGQAVHLFDAARTPGGRARRVASAPLSCDLDNGQHILLGAYTATLAQMQMLGLDPDRLFHRERLALRTADGSFRLRAARLPAPLHLLSGILCARGPGLAERLALIRIVNRLQRHRWQTPPDLTVLDWLQQGGQTAGMLRQFWQPLCLAALNTPPEQASAQLFANVLRDSLGGRASASDILIPATDLSRLWPERVIELLQGQPSATQYTAGPKAGDRRPDGSAVYLGRAVKTLQSLDEKVLVDGQPYDHVIVATNTPSAHRLLAQLPPCAAGHQLLSMLTAFEFIPIATLTLRLAKPWGLSHPMFLLRDDPVRLRFGQWLFDRSALTLQSGPAADAGQPSRRDGQNLVHVVISDARAMQHSNPDQSIAAIIAQLQEQAGQHVPMPAVTGHHLIVEKRATFKAAPGLARPTNQTPWSSVWLAGDWTDTGYPGVLEGAVLSGQQAAALALG